MTSTLTVIALIIHMKTLDKTVNGEAVYRDKVTNTNYNFTFKQFINARHDYNEAFRQGDLVLLGGKFTIDDKKLMLSVEMACVIEPKTDQSGNPVPWDPTQIPSTKPFVNIATTAYEPLTTSNDMKFIKTNSSIYSSFHKNTRKINFELGYSKDATWFDSISEKWLDYVYFFVGGFYEATYSTKEGDPNMTFTQIDARIIDYDSRFRQNTLSSKSSTPTNNLVTSAFAQRRSSQTPNATPSSSKRNSLNTIPQLPGDIDTNSVTMKDSQNNKQLEISKTDSITIDDVSDNQQLMTKKDSPRDDELNEFYDFYQKFKTQKLQSQKQSDISESAGTLLSHNSISGLAISEQDTKQKKRNLSDLCNLEDKQVDKQERPKRTYKKKSSNNEEHEESDKEDKSQANNKQRPKRNYKKK